MKYYGYLSLKMSTKEYKSVLTKKFALCTEKYIFGQCSSKEAGINWNYILCYRSSIANPVDFEFEKELTFTKPYCVISFELLFLF